MYQPCLCCGQCVVDTTLRWGAVRKNVLGVIKIVSVYMLGAVLSCRICMYSLLERFETVGYNCCGGRISLLHFARNGWNMSNVWLELIQWCTFNLWEVVVLCMTQKIILLKVVFVFSEWEGGVDECEYGLQGWIYNCTRLIQNIILQPEVADVWILRVLRPNECLWIQSFRLCFGAFKCKLYCHIYFSESLPFHLGSSASEVVWLVGCFDVESCYLMRSTWIVCSSNCKCIIMRHRCLQLFSDWFLLFHGTVMDCYETLLV